MKTLTNTMEGSDYQAESIDVLLDTIERLILPMEVNLTKNVEMDTLIDMETQTAIQSVWLNRNVTVSINRKNIMDIMEDANHVERHILMDI